MLESIELLKSPNRILENVPRYQHTTKRKSKLWVGRRYSKGLCVSGERLVVVVTRCGLNFKFVGQDLERCCQYVGYVHRDAVLRV